MKYIIFMPTKRPQLLLTLDDELIKRIEDFRFNNRIASRSDAVRQLIDAGLKASDKKSKSKKK